MNNIMEPFSINLDATIMANGNTNVNLVMEPVHLIVSYQVLLAMTRKFTTSGFQANNDHIKWNEFQCKGKQYYDSC
jgi:hypothetical protein